MIIELMSVCAPTDDERITEKEIAYDLCCQLKKAVELKYCEITVRERMVEIPANGGNQKSFTTYDVVIHGNNIPDKVIDLFHGLKAISYYLVDGVYHDCVRTEAWKKLVDEIVK